MSRKTGGPAALILALFLALGASSPAAAETASCPFEGQIPMLLVRLYFGQSIRGVGLVSRRAWERFLAEAVTAALPEGFTAYSAHGQYRLPPDPDQRINQAADRAAPNGQAGIGREATEMVEAAAPDTPAFRARVAALADAYRRRFSQSTVGIVSTIACSRF